MKKTVFFSLVMILLSFTLSASDESAKTISGRNVILHDDGTWEYCTILPSEGGYVGRWEMNEDALDALIDEYLVESGIDLTSPTYSFYRDYMKELIMQQLKSAGMSTVITLVLNDDGTCSVESGDESVSGTYSVSDDKTLTVTYDGENITFGTFNDDYSKIIIMNEEFFFLTKAE